MIHEVEQSLKRVVFSAESSNFTSLSEDGQALYRRLVRNTLFNAVSSQLPLAVHYAGQSRFHGWFSRWLDESPPQERIFWKLPIEFALWLHENASESDRFIAELAHFEGMQISCENAANYEGARSHLFSRRATVELDPSCRLCVYHFPVYVVSRSEEPLPLPLSNPNFVLIYRRVEAAHWTILEPQVAQLLAQLEEGGSLQEGIAFIMKLYPDADEGYLCSQLIKLNRLQALWWQPSYVR